MRAREPKPAFWVRLDLPASEVDRAEGLAELLRHLRVPAAVRHSPSEGGTFAVVPSNEDGSLLAVADTYGPELQWSLLSQDRLMNGLSSLAGQGSTLGGERIEHLADEHDSDPGLDATTPGVDGCVDAIAWTTHEKPGVLAAIGARFDMSFSALDAGEMGLALTVHAPADRDRALTDGVWAMTDGVAMWRSGEEASAAFVYRRSAVIKTWRTPWLRVDPSKPGQVDHDGATVSAMLSELVFDDGDPAAWVSRFRLDQEGGDRLRALFRRGAHTAALHDLCDILGIHPSMLVALSEDAESYEDRTMIAALSARQQFRDEMRAEIGTATPGPSSLRVRHPRIWLGVSAVVILVLTAVAVIGLFDGRPTAVLPGLVAAIWMASLVVNGSVRRARRGDSSEPAPGGGGRDR